MTTTQQTHADATTEAAKKTIAANKEQRDKARMALEDTKVKPTPTQEENDLAKLGVHVVDHEPDGSPEQPAVLEMQTLTHRSMSAQAPAGAKGTYPTRNMPSSAQKSE
jgi:hypothetical protein